MATVSSDAPTPRQGLFVWALVGRGGEGGRKELRPELDTRDRAALTRLGLLREFKVGRAIRFELTDRGWAWAAANTAAPLPTSGTAALPVLAALLDRLGTYLAARDVSLADFIRPAPLTSPPPERAHPEPAPPQPAASPAAEPADNPAERIRAACLAVPGGGTDRQVRLADIRARLGDMARADQDCGLLDLVRSGAAGLLRLDDPDEVTPADAAAALDVGGQARHLLWLRG
jgi:hypothetical protein